MCVCVHMCVYAHMCVCVYSGTSYSGLSIEWTTSFKQTTCLELTALYGTANMITPLKVEPLYSSQRTD